VPVGDPSDSGATNTTQSSVGQDQDATQSGLQVPQSGTGSTSLNLNTNDSSGNDGNQGCGNICGRNDPQALDQNADPLSKLRITYHVSGGPLALWAFKGTIVASEMV